MRKRLVILAAVAYSRRHAILRAATQPVADVFHFVYYYSSSRTWMNTHWLGTPVQKLPSDLWTYQQIIYDVRPDLIIEAGTFKGGSALYMASMCDLIGRGRIVSIDIVDLKPPHHQRIRYLLGSSTSPQIVEQVRSQVSPQDKVIVVLDSDHTMKHVLNELRIYSSLVTKGSYLIVEDTNINGHPVLPRYGPGPMEAVRAFLKENHDFTVDTSREKFLVTYNPSGYLLKVR
jgi:cephalosporin hydroxylase